MADEYDKFIDRKEFHEAIDGLREDIQEREEVEREQRMKLRGELQEIKEVVYNGVQSTAKENKEGLNEVKSELSDVKSTLDKWTGGWGMLKIIGTGMAGAVAILGTFVYVLYLFGAFAHWG